jgi:hypothetical protein
MMMMMIYAKKTSKTNKSKNKKHQRLATIWTPYQLLLAVMLE